MNKQPMWALEWKKGRFVVTRMGLTVFIVDTSNKNMILGVVTDAIDKLNGDK